MKRHWLSSGLVILGLAAGCDRAQQAEVAAEKSAAEMTATVEQAAQEAKADVEQAAQEAKADLQEAGAKAKAAVESAAADAANLKVGGVDLGKDLTALVSDVQAALGEVKDVESAKAALPKLDQANLGLDKLVGLVDQLPAAAKPVLASLIKSHSATINEAVKKVVNIEGVGDILKPILDQIVAKLSKVGGEAPAAP